MQTVFPDKSTQPSPKLLQEKRRAICRAKQQQRVHGRYVDALIEEVDGKEHIDAPSGEICERSCPFLVRAVGPHRGRGNSRFPKHPRHEPRMLNAHAEAERSHSAWIVNARHDLCEHMSGPGVIRGQKIREPLDVVASAAPPWHLTQIEPVVDAVVHERREPVLIDRIPKAQLGGDSIVEPVQQREAVASLRRRGKPQKFDRLDVLEKRAIGRRGSVMEFIDDDHVEVTGVEGSKAGRIEALDRSEDVVELPRTLPADPQLSERMIAYAVTKCRQALFEDLFTVRHEQQSRAREGGLEAARSRSRP